MKKEKFGRHMWRLTLGINNVPVSRKYHNETWIKYYNHEPTDSDIEEGKKEIRTQLEKRIKYRRSVWWFDDTVNISIERQRRDAGLIGRSFGEKVDIPGYRLTGIEKAANVKVMARRAIVSGKWYKKTTLDKWMGEFSASEWSKLMEMRGKF